MKPIARSVPFWLAVAAVLFLVLCLVWDGMSSSSAETVRRDFIMGTLVEVRIKGEKEDADSLFDTLKEAEDEVLSRRRETSEIAALNRQGQATLSLPLTQWLEQAKLIEDRSDGAFSLRLGALSDLWNFDVSPRLPSQGELDQALSVFRQGDWTLSGNTATLTPGSVMDLGSIGKGIACDLAKKHLISRGISSGVVSVGGSLLLLGEEERTVGIRHPFLGEKDVFATLRLKDCFVSTSGNYEKFFQQDGVRYHHILNPATGLPADSGLSSVTVVCRNGLISDALSTACFVLGEEKSRALLAQYEAEAVFITKDGQAIVTEGLQRSFALKE